MECVYYWQTPWITDNFCPKYWQMKRGVNRSAYLSFTWPSSLSNLSKTPSYLPTPVTLKCWSVTVSLSNTGVSVSLSLCEVIWKMHHTEIHYVNVGYSHQRTIVVQLGWCDYDAVFCCWWYLLVHKRWKKIKIVLSMKLCVCEREREREKSFVDRVICLRFEALWRVWLLMP